MERSVVYEANIAWQEMYWQVYEAMQSQIIEIYNPPMFTYIHTYIHNWPLQSFSQDYGLDSHTTHVACVDFIYASSVTYSVMSTPNDRFFEKFFHGSFIYSQIFCQTSAERKLPKKYIFFVFRFDASPGIVTRALRLRGQHSNH